MKLVRVQHEDGISADASGNVWLRRPTEDVRPWVRNTFHFTADCIVGNHAMGTFNSQVVVISDPADINKAPAGLNQIDTWIHADDDGALNVGKSVVLWPQGTEVPARLAGANIKLYEGDRDAAVQKHLADCGVQVQYASGRSWVVEEGGHINADEQHAKWREAVKATHYPDAADIFMGIHDDSPDCKLDESFNRLRFVSTALEEDKEFYWDGNIDVDTIHIANQRAADSHKELGAAYQRHESTRPSAGFLAGLTEKLATFEVLVENKAALFEQKAQARAAVYGAIEAMPGQGNFFVANATTAYLQPPYRTVEPYDMARMLADGEVAKTDLLFRQGLSPEWVSARNLPVGGAPVTWKPEAPPPASSPVSQQAAARRATFATGLFTAGTDGAGSGPTLKTENRQRQSLSPEWVSARNLPVGGAPVTWKPEAPPPASSPVSQQAAARRATFATGLFTAGTDGAGSGPTLKTENRQRQSPRPTM